MCRIEYCYVVYQDGARVRKEIRRVPCNRGTPSSLCRRTEGLDTLEEYTAAEFEARFGPESSVIEPRRHSPPSDLTVAVKGWKPFSLFKRKPTKFILIHQPGHSDESAPKQLMPAPQSNRTSPPPVIITREPREARLADREARLKERRPTQHSEINRKDRKRSDSPVKTDEYYRTESLRPRIRSSSRLSKHEAKIAKHAEGIADLEQARAEAEAFLQQHKYRAALQQSDRQDRGRQRAKDDAAQRDQARRESYSRKVAKEERKALDRAARLAREQEKEQEDLAWARREGKKPISSRAQPDRSLTDEALRAQQEQREEDIRRIRAADQRRADEAEEARESEHTRREDQRRAANRDRLARQRTAGIPRGPRHRAEVHHPHNDEDILRSGSAFDDPARFDQDDFDRRGDAFIASAIRAEEERNSSSSSIRPSPRPGRDGFDEIDAAERRGRRREGGRRGREGRWR